MRRSILIALAALAAITACSDTSAPPAVQQSPTRLSPATTPTELDIEIGSTIIALFPKGLETAAGTRWGNIKRKLAEGDSKTAISMFSELSDWIIKKQGQMDGAPVAETEQHATARLLGMMAAYVFGGEPPIPLDSKSGDVGIGQVLPGLATVITTPLKRAGVEFDIGSVLEPTLVVISQNLTPYEHCKGPLQTALCQYPTFYKFEPFPYRKLEKPARFGVCHVNTGPFAPPEGIHDRFRLAHTKPADPNNYTPGAIRPEGENIEILPLVHVGFMDCKETSYGAITPNDSPLRERHWYDRGLLALGYALDKAGTFLTPKDAYAIDLGGGGEGWSFSDFNVVDPQSNFVNFERFSSGDPTSPKCDVACDISTEYRGDGVIFEFRPTVIEGTPPVDPVTLQKDGSNNPDGDANNHIVANARNLQTGGYLTGTMALVFGGNPHGVTLLLRANQCARPEVSAFAPGDAGQLEVAHTDEKLYGDNGQLECNKFRQERITVVSDGGIARITLSSQALMLVDDIRITPQ